MAPPSFTFSPQSFRNPEAEMSQMLPSSDRGHITNIC